MKEKVSQKKKITKGKSALFNSLRSLSSHMISKISAQSMLKPKLQEMAVLESIF